MAIDPRIQAALDAPLKGRPNLPILKKPLGGYAAPPETGPAGETCRSCRHCYPHETRAGGRFYKCRLTRLTSGPGSDIKLKSPACRKWEAPRG